MFYGQSFNTDIPFVMLLVVALWAYARGLRTRSLSAMLLGSAVGALAILTRQIGVALIVGLGVAWLTDRDRWRFFAHYAAGGALLVVATAAQGAAALLTPNWSAQVVAELQVIYFAQGLPALAVEVADRFARIAVLVAVYLAPLSVVCLPHLRTLWRAPSRRLFLLGGLIASLAVVVSFTGEVIRERTIAITPFFVIPIGDVTTFQTDSVTLTRFIVLMGGIAGIFVATFIVGVSAVSRSIQTRSDRLLLAVAGGLFVFSAAFFKTMDNYTIPFLPFVLIWVGRAVAPRFETMPRWVFAAVSTYVLVNILMARALVDYSDAHWRAAQVALAVTGTHEEVMASWMWLGYQGEFDRFIREAAPHRIVTLADDPYDAFAGVWLRERNAAAAVRVINDNEHDGEPILAAMPYHDVLLQPRQIYAVSVTGAGVIRSDAPDEEQP